MQKLAEICVRRPVFATVLVLALGGPVHGALLASRVADRAPQAQREAIERYRWAGNALLLFAVVAAFVWFVLFTSGVPPWAD